MNIHSEFFEGGLCTFKYECGGKNKILGVVHRVLIAGQKRRNKRGQSCKSAAVAFNGRLMEISYFENFCRPRYSIPSHHAWNSKILLDIPTKSSRNFQRNWYLQHTENNLEAAALYMSVYALDVAKKKYKTLSCGFSGSFTNVRTQHMHAPRCHAQMKAYYM